MIFRVAAAIWFGAFGNSRIRNTPARR